RAELAANGDHGSLLAPPARADGTETGTVGQRDQQVKRRGVRTQARSTHAFCKGLSKLSPRGAAILPRYSFATPRRRTANSCAWASPSKGRSRAHYGANAKPPPLSFPPPHRVHEHQAGGFHAGQSVLHGPRYVAKDQSPRSGAGRRGRGGADPVESPRM